MSEAAATMRRRSWPKRIGRWLLWLLALLIVVLAIGWWLARPAAPDAFYQWPSQLPARPGALLRAEPFERAVPEGARAWRILYTTTRSDNRPVIASAIVLTSASPSRRPRPVVAWAHGTTGIVPGCAPSLLADPFKAIPAVPQLLAEGWVLVGTDYAGLGTEGGHAYLVGDDAARAVLDSVRAARRLEGVQLDSRTLVWGHSQGGGSALWTGMRQPAYAPDVPLSGVAAMAPASDLPALMAESRGSMFGKIVSSLLLHAYAGTYADVRPDDYVQGRAALLSRDIAARCLSLFSVLETMALPGDGIFAREPGEGPLGARLRENVPDGQIAAPLLLQQGGADDLVLPRIQRGFVARRCARGQRVDYRVYPGRDHMSVLAADSPLVPELIAWTRDRFAGRPETPVCRLPA